MKLLFISNNFPTPFQATRSVFNLEMARALAEEHELKVVCPVPWVDELNARRQGRGSIPKERSAWVSGIEVHYPRYYYTPKILRRHYGQFFWHSIQRTIKRLFKVWKPDAVIGYWIHPDGEAAVRAAKLIGVPSAIMTGGSDVLVIGQQKQRGKEIGRVLRSSDAVIAVSRDLAEKIAEYGVEANRISVIERGIDRVKFSPGNQTEARRRLGISWDGPMLLWVGRMVPVKGLDTLIEACARLGTQDQKSRFRLYLVGSGPLKSALEAECEAKGLSDIVSFVGSVNHDQLADWYRAADWMLLPSRSEGSPNVLRESLACGTPFIASRVGGIPDLAGDRLNRLVEPGSAKALAEAIASALTDPPASSVEFHGRSWAEGAKALANVIRSIPKAATPTR